MDITKGEGMQYDLYCRLVWRWCYNDLMILIETQTLGFF